MQILVTGATGTVGRNVVAGLLEAGAGAGVRVRALTRNPATAALPGGAEVVPGDLAEPATLRAALAGVDRLYLFPVAETAREVVALAREAGVRRVVTLSSGAVTNGFDTTYHLPVERAVEDSGVAWTHVRPGEFAANKLALWGPSIREHRTVYHPSPEDAWFPVHERDIADVAVAALLDEADAHAGAAHTLNGPELLTLRDQVRAVAEALGEEIHFERTSREEARERYLAQGGFAAENADFLLGFETYDGAPATPDATAPSAAAPDTAAPHATAPDTTAPGATAPDTTAPHATAPDAAAFDPATLGPQPTTRDAIGQPARTFAQWARDHAADFR